MNNPTNSTDAENPEAKSPEKDWTRLLTDPVLVGHIGKLLQAYREAAPGKREEALVAAMRKIRQESVASAALAPMKAQAAAATAVTPQADRTAPPITAPVLNTVPEPKTSVTPTATQTVRPPFVPDLFTPSVGQDRRAYPRLRCFIAVELRSEGWDAPVWGNLANVSAGGCLIETLEPVRKNTQLEVGLWANNGKVWAKGVVINGIVTENKPTFGVRLQYTNMNADDRDTLRFFLKCVDDTTRNYEKQNGYLAQLKR